MTCVTIMHHACFFYLYGRLSFPLPHGWPHFSIADCSLECALWLFMFFKRILLSFGTITKHKHSIIFCHTSHPLFGTMFCNDALMGFQNKIYIWYACVLICFCDLFFQLKQKSCHAQHPKTCDRSFIQWCSWVLNLLIRYCFVIDFFIYIFSFISFKSFVEAERFLTFLCIHNL